MALYANGTINTGEKVYADGELLSEKDFTKDQLKELEEQGSAVSSKKELNSAQEEAAAEADDEG